MKKDNYGVWEVIIPPNPDGTCAIPHDSKIKVSFVHILHLGTDVDVIADHDDHVFQGTY